MESHRLSLLFLAVNNSVTAPMCSPDLPKGGSSEKILLAFILDTDSTVRMGEIN